MGLFKGAAKTGIAMKVMDVVRREASKPQNQAKARRLFSRVTNRQSAAGAGGPSGRRAPRSRRTAGR